MPYANPNNQKAAMKRWREANAEHVQEYQKNYVRPPESIVKQRKLAADRYRQEKGPKTFIGCDGEGMGDGSEHRMYLFRMGQSQLVTGQPLTSWECLNFIADQTYGPIYTIFSGGYDFTMILRDAPLDFVRDLLNRDARMIGTRNMRPARWENLRVDYIAHKRLSVRRDDNPPIVIHDVFGFFQSSFLIALEEWQIGTPEQISTITEGKQRRGHTDVLSEQDVEYNRIECELLSELMQKLDDVTSRIMLTASPYEGAGALASSLLNTHIARPIKERNRVARRNGRHEEPIIPPDFSQEIPSWSAYYGGRFEIAVHGPIRQPVYEYDVNSAYPAAIRDLPCLHHGRFISGYPESLDKSSTFALGHVTWNGKGPYCPLPHRNKQGNVTFPRSGSGWYWSIEWPNDNCKIDQVYIWEPFCDHKPFYWIADRYEQRRIHKQAGRKGEAMTLKLGYNSIYGKLVQGVGMAPWRNSVLGGLVTAQCRRWLRNAANQRPDDIIMFATDAVYSLSPLDLPLSSELGEWEETVYQDGLHIVRPGIYFTPDGKAKVKTRGIGKKVVQEYASEIQEAFNQVYQHPEYLGIEYNRNAARWGVPIEYNGLVSIRLAYSQNRPEKAGYLGKLPHFMSYNIGPKRAPLSETFSENWHDGILRSAPPNFSIPHESVGYKEAPTINHDEEEAVASAPKRAPKSENQLELF